MDCFATARGFGLIGNVREVLPLNRPNNYDGGARGGGNRAEIGFSGALITDGAFISHLIPNRSWDD